METLPAADKVWLPSPLTPSTLTTTLTAAGGLIATPDGRVTLTFPPAAIDSPIDLHLSAFLPSPAATAASRRRHPLPVDQSACDGHLQRRGHVLLPSRSARRAQWAGAERVAGVLQCSRERHLGGGTVTGRGVRLEPGQRGQNNLYRVEFIYEIRAHQNDYTAMSTAATSTTSACNAKMDCGTSAQNAECRS